MTENELKSAIREAFPEKLTGIDFTIGRPEFQKVRKIVLPRGEELNGQRLADLFRLKTVYVWPERALPEFRNYGMIEDAGGSNSDTDSQSGNDTEDENEEMPPVYELQPMAVPAEVNVNINPVEEHVPVVAAPVIQEIQEAVTQMLASIDGSNEIVITVGRETILRDLKEVLTPTFNFRRKVRVIFSNEPGADEGGLTRECFRLATSSIQNLNIFAGPEKKKQLVPSGTSLRENWYFFAGAVIALSFMYGTSPHFFSNFLFESILGDASKAVPSISDVWNATVKSQLMALQKEEDVAICSDILQGAESLRAVTSKTVISSAADKEEVIEGNYIYTSCCYLN